MASFFCCLFLSGCSSILALPLHRVVFESMSSEVQWSASEAQLTAEFGHVISPLSILVSSLVR